MSQSTRPFFVLYYTEYGFGYELSDSIHFSTLSDLLRYVWDVRNAEKYDLIDSCTDFGDCIVHCPDSHGPGTGLFAEPDDDDLPF